MPSRAPLDWRIALLLSLFVIAVLTAVMVLPSLLTPRPSAQNNTAASSTATPTVSAQLQKARAILGRVRDEIIPREGQGTRYEVSFSDAGYKTLMQWNEEFKVEASYADDFESLDLSLPCCEWSKPSRDEKSNCACGHHQALEGLAKKLLSDGWDRGAVQREITLWNRYLFPKEALSAEMARRAQLDPEIKAALEELQAHGEC